MQEAIPNFYSGLHFFTNNIVTILLLYGLPVASFLLAGFLTKKRSVGGWMLFYFLCEIAFIPLAVFALKLGFIGMEQSGQPSIQFEFSYVSIIMFNMIPIVTLAQAGLSTLFILVKSLRNWRVFIFFRAILWAKVILFGVASALNIAGLVLVHKFYHLVWEAPVSHPSSNIDIRQFATYLLDQHWGSFFIIIPFFILELIWLVYFIRSKRVKRVFV